MRVIAIDRVKREIFWRAELSDTPTLNSAISGDGSVVVIPMGAKMQAIVPAIRQNVWDAQVNQDISSIAIDWGRVFVSGYGGTVYALDHLSGNTNWQIRWRNNIDAKPLTDARIVLITDSEGHVSAVGADNGLESPDVKIDAAKSARAGPIMVDGWLLLQYDDHIAAYPPN